MPMTSSDTNWFPNFDIMFYLAFLPRFCRLLGSLFVHSHVPRKEQRILKVTNDDKVL